MLSLQCLSYQRHFLIPPPDIVIIGPAITISYSVFVVTGATSVVFATTLIIITYITAALIFQKNPTLFLVLISRCHLKVYTVQISKLPPISVSKCLLFPLFLLHKSSFSQVFPPANPQGKFRYLPSLRPRAPQPNPQSSLTPKTHQWQLGTSLMLYYIRFVCDYAIPVFHASLPQFLINDLEGVQKRALSIICPILSYDNAQASLVLELLVVYCQSLCQSLFDNILDCRDHRLHHFCQDFDVKFKLKGPGIVLVSIAVA